MRIKDSVLSELDDFHGWARGSATGAPITLLDYAGFVGTPDMVFGFAELFFPEMVVHEGRHFLASRFSPETYDQWVRKGTTPGEIQRVMNHVHMSTLLQNQEVSDEAAVVAARVIAAIWSRTLGPEGLTAESLGETFEDAAVTFSERAR